MKKSWIISLITSFVLLGGVFLSPAASANAAKVATSTYSDQSYSEDDYLHEELMDELELDDAEQELTKAQKEFEKYLEQISRLVPYENKAIDTLGSVGGEVNSTNRKSMYLKLTNTVIPNYTKTVSMLKQIKPSNPELKKIHAYYVKGSYLQLEGYLLYKQAVSKNKVNSKILQQGRAKVRAAGVLLDQYEQQIYPYARNIGYLH
ncbi:hypothetical protein BK141_17335 [Paenibacillus sp. FSL R5-0765]|uniref:hypothetical protein n=1 Tax=Paenibacillus sp. FSL R5-0765 TaxID=1920425 RepID=UPI00096D2850|nr:hypothetical protein [Paenibacillus sp. FSL R5-0765]OMF63509.1 hypothetical protein BK141_17335 [Paenibacillus sp. FSL R5-0765]